MPSDQSHMGTSATLGTVDPKHIPRVEQEASDSDSGSQKSGWTGYSFLTDRPGKGNEKSKSPLLDKSERNRRAANEAARRRRLSMLRDAHHNGVGGDSSGGAGSKDNDQLLP